MLVRILAMQPKALCVQGVKPWEDDAFEVLEFLRDPY